MTLLAGDIGGTRTTLALFSPECGLVSLRQNTYRSAEFARLAAVAAEFLDGADAPIDRAVVGVAGPVVGGRALATHLPWDLGEADLREGLGIGEV